MRIELKPKTIFTLSISENLNKGYMESFNFSSLDNLIKVINESLEKDYHSYNILNRNELTKDNIIENLSFSRGTMLILKRKEEDTELSILDMIAQPKTIYLVIGTSKIY